jgi:hypothetical protein
MEAIIRSVETSSQAITKLLLGDSVARQLYPVKENNDDHQSLACNQALSLAGHYFILKNFLKSHPPTPGKPYDVTLVYHPQSFSSNLDQVFTYHHFVKNFYREPYKDEFTPEVTASLAIIPYKYIARNPLIYTTNWAPVVHFDPKAKHEFISPINRVYLLKIQQLCKTHGLKFKLMPPWISTSKEHQVAELKGDVKKHPELKPAFTGYFEAIQIKPNSLFSDEIHLVNPKLGRDPLHVFE